MSRMIPNEDYYVVQGDTSWCKNCGGLLTYDTYRNTGSPEPDYDPADDPVAWRHVGGYAACLASGRGSGRSEIGGVPPLSEIQRVQMENSTKWFPELHAMPGSWLLLFQSTGFAEEMGEVVGGIKKAARHTAVHGCEASVCSAREEMLQKARDEVADPFAYLLNLCALLGVDLGEAWLHKTAFNETRQWEGAQR